MGATGSGRLRRRSKGDPNLRKIRRKSPMRLRKRIEGYFC